MAYRWSAPGRLAESVARQGGPDLNERQRAYLLAVFTVDQELEAEMRSLPYRPFQSRPKASEWRWLEYSEPVPEINKPASRLYAAIKKTAPIDQGTGATRPRSPIAASSRSTSASTTCTASARRTFA